MGHTEGWTILNPVYVQTIMIVPIPFLENWLWKLKLPLKINIFLWYLGRGVTLTKDNLIKRNWNDSPKCAFCNHNETLQHLFFDCHFARSVW
jgi:hypothetical protein